MRTATACLAEGACEADEDAGEAELEVDDDAMGVGRAVLADNLHGLRKQTN